jgi:hypothetical protein
MRTAAIIEKFRPVVTSALNSLIGEMMNERITTALKNEAASAEPPPDAEQEQGDAEQEQGDATSRSRIVTTEDELQAFFMVKAILAGNDGIDISKITYKDTTGYFAILFNGMPHKWICRIRTWNKKYLCLPDEQGNEVRRDFAEAEDLYDFKDALLASARRFFPQPQ